MATPISNFQPSASLYSAYGYGGTSAAPALAQKPASALGYSGASSFQSAIGAPAAGGAGAGGLQGIVQQLSQSVQEIGQLVQKLGGGAAPQAGGAQAQGGGAGATVGNSSNVGTGGAANVGTGQNAAVGTGAAGNVGTAGAGGGEYAQAAGYGANVGTGAGAAVGTGGAANVGTGQGAAVGTGGGAYGGYGAAGGVGAAGGAAQGAVGSSMPMPSDRNEYASYLQGATNGDGKQDGNVKQNRAMPNTRFGTVADGGAFKAAASRDYAIQFAAQAIGQSGRTVQGMNAGAAAFAKMSPDAQTFMQVASVYKGEGKNYDNGKLKDFLKQHGVAAANAKGVGDTDIETLGAVAGAINSGQISLKDITGTQGAVRLSGRLPEGHPEGHQRRVRAPGAGVRRFAHRPGRRHPARQGRRRRRQGRQRRHCG